MKSFGSESLYRSRRTMVIARMSLSIRLPGEATSVRRRGLSFT